MAQVEKGAVSSKGTKPLLGRRVVITRARSQADAFARAIEDVGGEVVEFPAIEILPPESYDRLDRAIQRAETYDWIVFTSANGVKYFLARFEHLNRGIQILERVKIVAIGPETAKALESAHLRVALLPRKYRAEGILEGLTPDEMRSKKVLLPRAGEARDVLPMTLRNWGAEVDVVEAYRTVAAKSDASWLRGQLAGNKIDMVTFTSSSTVTHFAALFSGEDLGRFLGNTVVACIGPITHETAKEKGIRVDVVPQDYTVDGLTKAIVDYFSQRAESP